MTEQVLAPQPRFVDSQGYRTKLVIPDVHWCIYGHPGNFNYFVETALQPASAGARELKVGSRKAHTRRAYTKAASSSNVTAHTRDWLFDPGRKVGTAIPGWSFILDDGTEKRQFTFVGDVVDLHAFLVGEAKTAMKLYTSGPPYQIAAATSEGAKVTTR